MHGITLAAIVGKEKPRTTLTAFNYPFPFLRDAFSLLVMSTKPPSTGQYDLPPDARIAIVAARFNAHIVDPLLEGCIDRFDVLGIGKTQIEIHRVPGAFELPVAAKWLAQSGKFSAVVCVGAVVRGDTPHFEYVAGEAARGIQNVAIETGVPIIFGVLTTNTEEQALARTGGTHGHAGERAADAAAEMIALKFKIDQKRR
jgi:6,7-dimethyl-8-ribityllumazine synthase